MLHILYTSIKLGKTVSHCSVGNHSQSLERKAGGICELPCAVCLGRWSGLGQAQLSGEQRHCPCIWGQPWLARGWLFDLVWSSYFWGSAWQIQLHMVSYPRGNNWGLAGPRKWTEEGKASRCLSSDLVATLLPRLLAQVGSKAWPGSR